MNIKAIKRLSCSRFPGPRSRPSMSACAGAAALCVLAATACSKPAPTPEKEPAPSAQPSAAIVAPTASAVVEAVVPTLVMEKFAPEGVHLTSVHAVEGALMVVSDHRVGRIVGESVEWLKKTVPASMPGVGDTRVESIKGRWPDGIGALYSTNNGRAPQPTYTPLTGVGLEYTAAPGGGLGYIYGVARLGDSYVVAAYGHGNNEISTVRGTAVRKPQTPEQAGCKEGDVRKQYNGDAPAVAPSAIESTPEGTLVSLGTLCGEREPAVEVWDKAGKSRIIKLSGWWKKMSSWPTLAKGKADEVWAYSDPFSPILHYKSGEIEAVPDLERPVRNIFVSTRGELHAHDGRSIHRYAGGKWTPVGHVAEPEQFFTMAMDENEAIWVSHGTVSRLRPKPDAAAVKEGCATPFVYLYEVSYKNEKNFSYPSTRKALSSFPEVGAIGLVEFEESYRKRLGITVTSKAQGEAVIAHLRETMKEEAPRLTCYEPPKDARKIDMNAKK